MKKSAFLKMKQRWGEEALPAGIIVFSILLCIFLSFLGFLENRRSAEKGAAPAAAQIQEEPEETKEGEEREISFANYRQLSDPLLVLVNDQVPLPESWSVTPRMIDDEQVDLRMYDALTEMFARAAEDDVWFWVASGYRSVEEQEIILERATTENSEKGMTAEAARTEALRTIARPGYSEHHTGLAVDLNDVSDDFEETEAYRWLSKHAADYGFVQRYEKDKVEITGIDNESWHYRYVGRKSAREMKKLNMCLEEYVLYLQKQGIR